MRGPDHASMLELSFASAEAPLSVRSFTALERASDLFECDVQAVSDRSSLDLAELVGSAAELRVSHALSISGRSAGRVFRGVCTHAEQVRVEPDGVSTYHVRIAPALWLLTQRTDHRIFQRMAIPEIVGALLDEWRVPHAWRFDMSSYPKLDYRVQYGETDYAFVSRLLEEVGIAFVFEAGDAETRVVFDDALGACSSPSETLPFVDQANAATGHAYVSRVRFAQVLRPSAMVLRDHDLRRPAFELEARSDDAESGEERLEQRRYAPGAFLRIRDDEGGGTPTADDKGAVRHDAELGGLLAARALESLRADRRQVSFATNVASACASRGTARAGSAIRPRAGSAYRRAGLARATAASCCRGWGKRCSSASSTEIPTSRSSSVASSTRSRRTPTRSPSTRRGARGGAHHRLAAPGTTRSSSRILLAPSCCTSTRSVICASSSRTTRRPPSVTTARSW